MSSPQAILGQMAEAHGARVIKAEDYDPNICTFVHDRANRAKLVLKSGQPLTQKVAFELRGFRIQIFANDSYLRMMVVHELPEVFSINRIDRVAGLKPAGMVFLAQRAYPLGTSTGAAESHPALLKERSFQDLCSKLRVRENESVHVYRNGLVVYLCAPDRIRAEESVEAAVSFSAAQS